MTVEKVTADEEVDKEIKKLNNMKEAAVTIRGEDLDHFEGHYKGSSGWFNTDYEFKKNVFYI